MVPKTRAYFLICALLLLLTNPALAEAWQHAQALAMYGNPKMADDAIAFDYVNPDAPKGGTLRLNIVGSFDSLNPYIVKGKPADGLTYVYETLLARSQDEPFTLYPLIASSLDVLPDRSAIRFHLNPQARWQDGSAITADDILFSWVTLKAKGKPNLRSYYAKVEKAEALDERTVQFSFRRDANGKVDREMPLIIGLMPILPKHFWTGKAFDETSLAPPLGSGPYRLTEVQPGRSLVFSRDKNYWGRDLPSRRGQFNFDTIRYDYYRDEHVAMEAFTAHLVDARRETDPTRWDELKQLKSAFKTFEFHHHRPEAFRGFAFNLRRAAFADVRVREALTLAFDFEWMNRTLFRSAYQRTNSAFANSELAATGIPDEAEKKLLEPWRAQLPPALFEQPFHLPQGNGQGPAGMREPMRRATQLLEQAGYKIKDGMLTDQTGKPFTFEIMLSDPQDEKIALEYARCLERLGMHARIRTVDSAQFQARLNDFDFDVVLNRWINSLSPGNEQAAYWGSASADIKGSRNITGIKNPVLDDLAARITTADTREGLVATIHALDRVLMWSYVMVPLFYRGADCFAIWDNIAVPDKVPLYGPVVESWWAVQKTDAR